MPDAKLAQMADVKPRYLKEVALEKMPSLPEEARAGVVAWIDSEVTRVSAKQQPGDELWYFREEKCPNCHWYREGYALIRGCEVVDEITIRDDM
jgi:hypothetical protein